MKYKLIILFPLLLLFSGCSGHTTPAAQIVATTKPVCFFARQLCSGTGLTVDPLITESVSCLHDYTVSVDQVRAAESAELILCSGAGLEHFMEDVLTDKRTIDSSSGISLLTEEDEPDPHIWLSVENAQVMVSNLSKALAEQYPQHRDIIFQNEKTLQEKLNTLRQYSRNQLQELKYRDIITFHDGFAYFAQSNQLTILESIEEEAGSEASAKELVRLIQIVKNNRIPAIFIESNGSPSAASIISAETGTDVFSLDMGMSDLDYFECMYHNIDTIREALG